MALALLGALNFAQSLARDSGGENRVASAGKSVGSAKYLVPQVI
jgi:hypothetical protein